MQRRTLVSALGALTLGLTLSLSAVATNNKEIIVGVTAGPHAEVMDVVKAQADKVGFKMRIIEFTDFIQPNAALAAGDIDINSFQHLPYLEQQNKDRGYKLASVAQTITFPLTYYSRKGYKSLKDLPRGARIAIPNDPTNGSRALNMLAEQGVIKLKDNVGNRATVLDITDNPNRFRIIELEAAQLPRSLEDLDAAAINGSYAEPAGLDPQKDGLYTERADGPYANILVVREADLSKPWVKEFVKIYHSPTVKAFIEKRFKGGMICAW